MTKKAVIAMSGGVDSSVAAALLKNAGFEVTGIFMRLYSGSSRGSEKRAKKVAKILGIPFQVFNFEKEFKKKVIDDFLREYKKGKTPNPCVVCNKQIKFGLLLKKTLALGSNYIATGHYARKREIKNQKSKIIYKLLRAKDKTKDQSYFLWQLNQKQLKHILFPLGNYTKKEVRDLAKKFKLPVLDVPESQEICFIPKTINEFLRKHFKPKPGKIIDTEGKLIGKHQGLYFYTIGQRKGIELPGGPFYVVRKDYNPPTTRQGNALIVAPFFDDEALYKKSLTTEKINWISDKQPRLPLKVKAQIRYGHKAVPAQIASQIKADKSVKTYKIIFARPQRAITSGQSVVFYKGQELLGGGLIG